MTTLSLAMRHRFATGRMLDMQLEAPLPGIVGLFGPSGAGKSMLVSALCGLFRPDWSEMRIGDRVLSGPGVWVRPEARRIGMVFQDSRLFPHLSVETNLRYGAHRAPTSPSDHPGFEEAVSLLGLDGLLGRRTRALSGGERQRVAIGRALLSRPMLLAMDEPLSGLDAARRGEILFYLGRLRDRLRLPILYVTHALDEVMRLCDTVALVEEGSIRACGPVATLLLQEGVGLVDRDDAGALFEAEVRAHDTARGLTLVQAGGFSLAVTGTRYPVGARLRLTVPAREVVLLRFAAPETLLTSAQNVVAVRVRAVAAAGSDAAVVVLEPDAAAGRETDAALLARVTADSVRRLGLVPGVCLVALVKTVSIVVLDEEIGHG